MKRTMRRAVIRDAHSSRCRCLHRYDYAAFGVASALDWLIKRVVPPGKTLGSLAAYQNSHVF